MSDEQVIVGVRAVVLASALLLRRLRDPEFLALTPTDADLSAADLPAAEPRPVPPGPPTEDAGSSEGGSRSARVRGLARRGGNLVRQQVHSGLERWSATRPGSEHWNGLDTEQRVAWWLATIGRTSAVTAALPGLAGYAGDRIPVADLVSAAGQGLLLCAIAGEHAITDPDPQVRLIAEVLFDRRLDPATAHLGDTTTARHEAEHAADEPDLAASTVRARTLAAAKVLIRLGRSLRGLQDELDKRPQGHLGQRIAGSIPVVGIVGHYRGERRGLQQVADQGQQWCRRHSIANPQTTPPHANSPAATRPPAEPTADAGHGTRPGHPSRAPVPELGSRRDAPSPRSQRREDMGQQPNERIRPHFREEIAPLFASTDIERSVQHYTALGFRVKWDRIGFGENLYGYAFARRHNIGLHIVEQWNLDPDENMRQAFFATPDPDALAAEWIAAGVGKTHKPSQMLIAYEGVHLDPDLNRLRFGIPVVLPGQE